MLNKIHSQNGFYELVSLKRKQLRNSAIITDWKCRRYQTWATWRLAPLTALGSTWCLCTRPWTALAFCLTAGAKTKENLHSAEVRSPLGRHSTKKHFIRGTVARHGAHCWKFTMAGLCHCFHVFSTVMPTTECWIQNKFKVTADHRGLPAVYWPLVWVWAAQNRANATPNRTVLTVSKAARGAHRDMDKETQKKVKEVESVNKRKVAGCQSSCPCSTSNCIHQKNSQRDP